MRLLSLEQDRVLLRADFAFYGLVVGLLAALAWRTLPVGHAWQAAGWVGLGLASWTLAEYGLHRFVLHGIQPFKGWHAMHHARPVALIGTPTLFTAALFALLVGLPVWWLFPLWRASALGMGVMLGYLAYIVTHYAVHHVRGGGPWLRAQKHWHALHHRGGSAACYGVSLPWWDHALGTARPRAHERDAG